ncbi:MAG: PD40 domain-containing protein, partial [Bdellovibrionales bacterium]|nr:PD40 domain-containing protein [Bdellovibrionales bacterium]
MLRASLIALFVFTFNATAFGQAKIFLDIGDARVRKSKLALPSFNYLGSQPNSSSLAIGEELYSVISNDLAATGLFVNIDPKAFLEDTTTTALKPSGNSEKGFDFTNWKTIETEFLIRGGYQVINGDITLEIYAYYIPQGNLIIGKKYTGTKSTLRKIAHTFANDFIKAVTGKPSFFMSQIVTTIDNGPQTNREVYIADWDGHNASAVTNHKTITVSPAWSKNGDYIAYTAFVKRKVGRAAAKRNPDMFVYELKTKRRWLVSYRDGLNTGAEFMIDNKNLLLTLSKRGSADIYKMTLDGKTISPITHGPGSAMNVEPAVSPDGTMIAFSSDRSGKPMIYTMSADGTNVKRKTFAGHYNSTPTWSPDGKKLAF